MHLSKFFKKVGRGAMSVFGLARQKQGGGGADAGTTATATEQPTLHDATTNAGEGVVNFGSMQMPTAQQQQAARANPQGTPMGQLPQ